MMKNSTILPWEDRLSTVQLSLYLLAVLTSLLNLPLVFVVIQHSLWKQAWIRTTVSLGPPIIFLGTEGLIFHFLWWLPIDEADRFRMVHHSLFAGGPAVMLGWLAISRPEYNRFDARSLRIDQYANAIDYPLIVIGLLLLSVGFIGLLVRYGHGVGSFGLFSLGWAL